LGSRILDLLDGFEESCWDKATLPYIYDGSQPIEGNPNRQNTNFLLFISKAQFYLPNHNLLFFSHPGGV
jgi:hypothetical protein